MRKEWRNFKEGAWTTEVNVRDFIQKNYKNYEGDESFLEGTTKKTDKVWAHCTDLLKEELKKHVDNVASMWQFNCNNRYLC